MCLWIFSQQFEIHFKQKYLLFGGQFSYAVRFVEGKVYHGLKQSDRLLWVTRLTQEMTLLHEDIWTEGNIKQGNSVMKSLGIQMFK